MEQSFGILAVKDGMVLVIHQVSGDHWTFCKGRPKPSEAPKDTALRELKEEVNLEVLHFWNDKTYVQEYPVIRRGRKLLKRVSFFLAEVTGTLALQRTEVADARWMSWAEAEEQLTYEEDRALLREIMPDVLLL